MLLSRQVLILSRQVLILSRQAHCPALFFIAAKLIWTSTLRQSSRSTVPGLQTAPVHFVGLMLHQLVAGTMRRVFAVSGVDDSHIAPTRSQWVILLSY